MPDIWCVTFWITACWSAVRLNKLSADLLVTREIESWVFLSLYLLSAWGRMSLAPLPVWQGVKRGSASVLLASHHSSLAAVVLLVDLIRPITNVEVPYFISVVEDVAQKEPFLEGCHTLNICRSQRCTDLKAFDHLHNYITSHRWKRKMIKC